jgi:hydroxypyruvate reductase
MKREKIKEISLDIFAEAIHRVDPKEITAHALDEYKTDFKSAEKLFVIAVGKAAYPMSEACEDFFGDRISRGIVLTKYGHGGALRRFGVIEAGHPIPDENGITGAQTILALAREASENDLVLVLLSGGGSALLTSPAAGITINDLKTTNQFLIHSGASIHEINAVRKHLSRITGGHLALAAHPATVVTLILSDVVDDDLSTIASGPTAPDPTTFRDALSVIQKYDGEEIVPLPVVDHLTAGIRGSILETPKETDPVFRSVENRVIGNAALALSAADRRAYELGLNTSVLSSSFSGDTAQLSRFHAAVAREILTHRRPVAPPACVISGGETTVFVRGSGKGGRNTEFALSFAIAVQKLPGVFGLFCGSDGTDGPTDAAGAFAGCDTVQRARERGLDPDLSLENSDSYPFFDALGDLIKTGPTQTNVMDIRLVFVTTDSEHT